MTINFKRNLNILKTNSFFLFGARGTGKTRLINDVFSTKDTLKFDLLDTKLAERLRGNPSIIIESINKQSNLDWVVIDEVQKIPELLDEVHKIIEDKNIKFILTGSSARKLKRGGANLLAGRAFVYNLFPLTHVELAEKFDLIAVLQWGSLPKIFQFESSEEKELFLDAYVNTYLTEEILSEQIVRNLIPFKKFLCIAAQSSGNIVNYSNIGKDIGVDDKTSKTYFQILEDTLLGFFLPAYDKSLRKQQLKSPKFYLFDLGVKRFLEGSINNKLLPNSLGKAFEHFIICEIHRLNLYQRTKWSMYYLATASGAEIDLILEKYDESPVLIEIKSTEKIIDQHISTLFKFKKEFPSYRTLCLSQDKISRVKDGVEILYWKDGLRELGFDIPLTI